MSERSDCRRCSSTFTCVLHIHSEQPTYTLAQVKEAIRADREKLAGLVVKKLDSDNKVYLVGKRTEPFLTREEAVHLIRTTPIGDEKE